MTRDLVLMVLQTYSADDNVHRELHLASHTTRLDAQLGMRREGVEEN